MSIIRSKPTAPTTPKALLTIFVTTAITAIVLVIVNLLQPSIIAGPLSIVINIIFWVTFTLAFASLIGIIWYALRHMARSGFSRLEQILLCILASSFVIVNLLAILAIFGPENLLTQSNSIVNQLFWGMILAILICSIFFILLRFSNGKRQRKKKNKMYYY